MKSILCWLGFHVGNIVTSGSIEVNGEVTHEVTVCDHCGSRIEEIEYKQDETIN